MFRDILGSNLDKKNGLSRAVLNYEALVFFVFVTGKVARVRDNMKSHATIAFQKLMCILLKPW